MATYRELYNLRFDTAEMLARTTVACVMAARTIFLELGTVPNHAARLVWAKACVVDARGQAERLMWAVVLDPAVQAAGAASTDAQIQAAVDSAVNVFAQI